MYNIILKRQCGEELSHFTALSEDNYFVTKKLEDFKMKITQKAISVMSAVSIAISMLCSTANADENTTGPNGALPNQPQISLEQQLNDILNVTDPFADRYNGYSSGKYDVNNSVVKSATNCICV